MWARGVVLLALVACGDNNHAPCNDTSNDIANCGACGVVCSTDHVAATCTAGVCGGTCDLGFGDCNGDPSDGCETDTTLDRNCGGCGITCTTMTTCAPTAYCDVGVCRALNKAACGNAPCELAADANFAACEHDATSPWADSDGDGFTDAQERAGYIDLDCNGRFDPDTDLAFPMRAQHVFGDVVHVGSSAAEVFPTVTDPTQPIAVSQIVVTVDVGGPPGTAMIHTTVNGGTPTASVEARPVVDIAGNVRLMLFTDSTAFAAGDTYTFTTEMGAPAPIADENTPNIYVAYDYMGFDAGAGTCTVDKDCDAGGNELNFVCHDGGCTHDHAPGDPLFRKIVAAFAQHGMTLYIDPVHHAIPHAHVITWNKPGDGTTGATAACAGYDVVAGDISTGGAVSFDDVKHRPAALGFGVFDPRRTHVYHYTVFAHASSCLASGPGNCASCPGDRSPLGGVPNPGASGTAELPGNDFIVSLGDMFAEPSASTPRDPFIEGGTFMHELGHNLGLHHDGDNGFHSTAPNYFSVMGYNFTFSGIQHAATAGGTVEVSHELDYSEHTLNTLDEAALSEPAGMSPLASGYTGITGFFDPVGGFHFGAESGPVDWDNSGSIGAALVAANIDGASGPPTMNGYRDWSHTTGASGAGGGACTTSADCRINEIRHELHVQDPAVDEHEACVRGVCQPQILGFQCFHWGEAGGPPPVITAEPSAADARARHTLYPPRAVAVETTASAAGMTIRIRGGARIVRSSVRIGVRRPAAVTVRGDDLLVELATSSCPRDGWTITGWFETSQAFYAHF